MKYSNNYIFYPVNKSLEQAIQSYISNLPDSVAENAKPDTAVTVPDNFTYTRGNFEQRRYSSNILDSAQEHYETLVDKLNLESAPLEWATTQNHLGNILAAQGQQLRDESLYEKAIKAFILAFEVFDQKNTPSDWATTQYNLGTASQALARQLSDSKLFTNAADAYTNALLVWSKEQNPLEWALTMHQLGATFHAHGKLLKGNRTLQKSVVAYKNALAEFDADNSALELAATHNSRGAVLHHLGESEANTERLEEAIRAYDKGLTVSMEQQLPIHLSVLSKVNIATARGVLAVLTKDSTIMGEVADEFEVILECFRDSLQPLCLKHCEEQLNKAESLASSASHYNKVS